jgi:C-terminal processing protease CtpA/Prc
VIKAAVAVSILWLLLAGISLASPPTTKPVATDQITTWFKDLANPDQAVRQKARVQLMGISREDLAKLRTIVEKSRPLAPSQAAALHDIVEQVFLAGEPYPEFPNRPGFLGVRFENPVYMVLQGNGEQQENSGVVVAACIPGFCANQFLQSGDVIVGVNAAAMTPIRTKEDLMQSIGDASAGDEVRLQVLRGGQEVEATIKLNARPLWAPQAARPIVQPAPPFVGAPPKTTDDEIRDRERKADEYWDREFAPLLDDGMV